MENIPDIKIEVRQDTRMAVQPFYKFTSFDQFDNDVRYALRSINIPSPDNKSSCLTETQPRERNIIISARKRIIDRAQQRLAEILRELFENGDKINGYSKKEYIERHGE